MRIGDKRYSHSKAYKYYTIRQNMGGGHSLLSPTKLLGIGICIPHPRFRWLCTGTNWRFIAVAATNNSYSKYLNSDTVTQHKQIFAP